MPDFPKIGGATAAEVAAAILVDPATDKIDGSKVDAAVSSRSTLTQAQIISDTTPFLGASVAAVKAKTDIIGASVALETAGNVAAVLAKTDVATSTRAAIADYTAGRATKMDKIQDFLEEGTGTLTADGTLQIVRAYTGTGKLHCYIDLTNMAAGDTTVISQFMTIKTAGTYRKYAEETYTGAQALPLLHIIAKPGKFGVRINLQQSAGTNRTYDWETLVEQAAA